MKMRREIARFGIQHTLIRRVKQRNQRRTTNAAHHDDITNFADDAMDLYRIQTSTSGVFEDSDRVIKKLTQRSRSRSSPSECLEWAASRSDLRIVDIGKFPRV